MKSTNLLKTGLVIVVLMIAHFARTQPVIKGSSAQVNHFTKWETIYGEYKITNSNVREDETGLVIVGYVTTPFYEEEKFLVSGNIGLYSRLDYKTSGGVISWGDGSDAASLIFISKILQLDYANLLIRA